MLTFLLAVDGSDSSLKAAEKTSELTEFHESQVSILTVLDISKIELSELQSYRSEKSLDKLIEKNKGDMNKKGKQILNEAAEYFKGKNTEIKKIIKYGDAADVICDYAEEKNFDFIILADKGLSGVKRFFLGSISDKVVRHAKSSVIIVR